MKLIKFAPKCIIEIIESEKTRPRHISAAAVCKLALLVI